MKVIFIVKKPMNKHWLDQWEQDNDKRNEISLYEYEMSKEMQDIKILEKILFSKRNQVKTIRHKLLKLNTH